jgi:transglutaminase-like putative cysteine protease
MVNRKLFLILPVILLLLVIGCSQGEPESAKKAAYNKNILKEKSPLEKISKESSPELCQGKMDFIGSDDPEDFLGELKLPLISISSKEELSIIQAKVDEITRGLYSDREKAEAIAMWVSQSRRYESPPFMEDLHLPSLFDVYNMVNGSSNEASLITAAMLRMAGIPSRVVIPQSHAIINGWYGFT